MLPCDRKKAFLCTFHYHNFLKMQALHNVKKQTFELIKWIQYPPISHSIMTTDTNNQY